MLSNTDFEKKQILVFSPARGDKISYRNDNMIIRNGEEEIKYQISCYRIFMLLIVGDCTLTTGIIRRAKKFGFSICFMTLSFRYYGKLSAGLEGNTLLHYKQYTYDSTLLAQYLIRNKIQNQMAALKKIRRKTEYVKEGISLLRSYEQDVIASELTREEIMGIEGNASKVYFPRILDNVQWRGRKPRIKADYINSLLDIGYNLLFNFVDSLLQVYDFDVYQGILHTRFYMRKSLVCDLMEPFRPIIDWKVRTGIDLGQFKKDDFVEIDRRWQLEYKKSVAYVGVFMDEILSYKNEIFLYIRGFYRAFMKERLPEYYPVFRYLEKDIVQTKEKEEYDDNLEL